MWRQNPNTSREDSYSMLSYLLSRARKRDPESDLLSDQYLDFTSTTENPDYYDRIDSVRFTNTSAVVNDNADPNIQVGLSDILLFRNLKELDITTVSDSNILLTFPSSTLSSPLDIHYWFDRLPKLERIRKWVYPSLLVDCHRVKIENETYFILWSENFVERTCSGEIYTQANPKKKIKSLYFGTDHDGAIDWYSDAVCTMQYEGVLPD